MISVEDEVLYAQRTFRQCMSVMARPGSTERISPLPWKDIPSKLSSYGMSIAFTLLDQEVTFHVLHASDVETQFVRFHTKARWSPVEQCDYLFLDGKDEVDVSILKRGSVQAPEQSCTVICLVDNIYTDIPATSPVTTLKLIGPGVPGEVAFSLDGISSETVYGMMEANREFPMGIDWIFVDRQGLLCGIPRSSRIEFQRSGPPYFLGEGRVPGDN